MCDSNGECDSDGSCVYKTTLGTSCNCSCECNFCSATVQTTCGQPSVDCSSCDNACETACNDNANCGSYLSSSGSCS